MGLRVYMFQFSIGVKERPWEKITTLRYTIQAYTDWEAYASALTSIWNTINVNTETLQGVEIIDVE